MYVCQNVWVTKRRNGMWSFLVVRITAALDVIYITIFWSIMKCSCYTGIKRKFEWTNIIVEKKNIIHFEKWKDYEQEIEHSMFQREGISKS